jgi:hypothetical protein
MEDGKSYVVIHSEHDEVCIPIKHFRDLMSVWNNKKWSEEWDTLDVTDRCFLVDD